MFDISAGDLVFLRHRRLWSGIFHQRDENCFVMFYISFSNLFLASEYFKAFNAANSCTKIECILLLPSILPSSSLHVPT